MSMILKVGIELNPAAVTEVKIRIIPKRLRSIFVSSCSLLGCSQRRNQTFNRMLSNSSRPRIVGTRPCNTTHIVQMVDGSRCNITIVGLHHIRFQTVTCPTFGFNIDFTKIASTVSLSSCSMTTSLNYHCNLLPARRVHPGRTKVNHRMQQTRMFESTRRKSKLIYVQL